MANNSKNKPNINQIREKSSLGVSNSNKDFENAIKIEDGTNFKYIQRGSKNNLMNSSQSSRGMSGIMSRMIEKRLDCDDI